jgi:putative transposase
MNTLYNKNSHSSFLLQAHIIFVTKYRERKLTNTVLNKAEEIVARECAKIKAELIEFNGESDHIHMIISYSPSLSISELVQRLKSVTGRELKLYFPELNQVAWRKNALWSPSYFACSAGGAPLSILRQYIEQQDRPH